MTYLRSGPDGREGAAAHRIAHDDTAAGPSLVAGWALHGERLEAHADRLGMIPIFYWHDAARIVVSDAIGEVVARVPRVNLDPVALAVFMRLGFHIGDHTPFEGIRVLPPGGRLLWEGGRVSLTRPELPIPSRFTGTFEQAVARYRELFEHAIATRAPPASGG